MCPYMWGKRPVLGLCPYMSSLGENGVSIQNRICVLRRCKGVSIQNTLSVKTK